MMWLSLYAHSLSTADSNRQLSVTGKNMRPHYSTGYNCLGGLSVGRLTDWLNMILIALTGRKTQIKQTNLLPIALATMFTPASTL